MHGPGGTRHEGWSASRPAPGFLGWYCDSDCAECHRVEVVFPGPTLGLHINMLADSDYNAVVQSFVQPVGTISCHIQYSIPKIIFLSPQVRGELANVKAGMLVEAVNGKKCTFR